MKINLVIATGGGTPCYGDTMNFLLQTKNCITIYLKASTGSLNDRLFPEKAKSTTYCTY